MGCNKCQFRCRCCEWGICDKSFDGCPCNDCYDFEFFTPFKEFVQTCSIYIAIEGDN